MSYSSRFLVIACLIGVGAHIHRTLARNTGRVQNGLHNQGRPGAVTRRGEPEEVKGTSIAAIVGNFAPVFQKAEGGGESDQDAKGNESDKDAKGNESDRTQGQRE
ncbi:hypothetical protein ERJ75_000030900 [Trypanosoma vivax]|nr:hypothetical protein ERJ75_000030900 [Trypanosoma vivax]